jgi:hypothetical protein
MQAKIVLMYLLSDLVINNLMLNNNSSKLQEPINRLIICGIVFYGGVRFIVFFKYLDSIV